MKDFNVLMTCSGMFAKSFAQLLKENTDGANVKVYACNMDENRLPPKGCTDGDFIAPKITDKEYMPFLLNLCMENNIDIIIPTVTLELGFMSKHAKEFAENGIKTSISLPETIRVANDKIRLYNRYSPLMPLQLTTHDPNDVLSFSKWLPNGSKLCCKLSDHAGGNGFAIVDDEKALDPTLFNRYATDRYISMRDLLEIIERGTHDVILQEYKEGYDYSVCVLANNGIVSHMVGFAGKVMSYGAIMNGEIEYNTEAYRIAECISKELRIDGNACFDFRISKDGSTTLLEINPRVNASLSFVNEAGINMLYLRCKNLLGDYSDLEKSYPIRYGLKMRKYYETVYYE